MFIRITRVETPPERVDAAIANFQERSIPSARSAPGYLGAILLADRRTGAGMALTYWESAATLAASEDLGDRTRAQAASAAGTRIVNVERYEAVIMDRAPGSQPRPGPFSRVNTLNADPARIDAMTVFVRNSALPVLKPLKGYRLTWMGVDRQTGRVRLATVWDSLDDLESSNAKLGGLREEAAKIGGASGVVGLEVFEVAAIEITPAILSMTGG